jgi:hypothetical protein
MNCQALIPALRLIREIHYNSPFSLFSESARFVFAPDFRIQVSEFSPDFEQFSNFRIQILFLW